MDVFVEQLVTRRRGAREFLCVFGLTLAGLLLVAASMMFVLSFAPVVLVLVCYGWWWCFKMLGCEYEYSVTNGDIDIDCIRGRSRRRRIVSVRGEKIESLAPCRADESFSRFDRIVPCSSGSKDAKLWCFTYHSKKNGHTVVIFEPNDRVWNALVEGLPYLVQREAQKAHPLPTETAE